MSFYDCKRSSGPLRKDFDECVSGKTGVQPIAALVLFLSQIDKQHGRKSSYQANIGHGQATPSAAASASSFFSAPASFGRLVPMEPASRT